MIVTGSKGGGGKGGGEQSQPGVESPNTLRSNTKARIVELLGSGEIVGLVDEAGNELDPADYGKAIYFGGTPLMNDDGSTNFDGVTIEQRVGLPDQEYLAGWPQASTPINVATQVKLTTGPVVRSVTNQNADAAVVIIGIPALAYQNKTTGDLTGASVSYRIDVRSAGGDWVEAAGADIVNQKCTSRYQRAHRIALPAGGYPWDLRVRRITADASVIELQNETHWDSFAEVVEGKFIYPNAALIAIGINASQFGTSIPDRAYRVKGLLTDVPSNYDPITREYDGVWDGTFKKSWHSNPAWVFWDVLINNRYGLGEFIDVSLVDKWTLYQIARYCDELVPSGFKDGSGDDIMEPRFSFNGVINTRKEAYKVLQDICSVFRGMAYWSLGQVYASADIPADPVTTLTPANVIGGVFKYSGTALKARHSAALVSWNDPNDFFRPAVELVQNNDMLARFGWREIEAQAIGTTVRGQAHRFGKWILDSEQNETETVEFQMSWDGYVRETTGGTQTLQPGNIVKIADPRKSGGLRNGGRIKSTASASVLTLDSAFEPTPGVDYYLTATLPDGSLEKRKITAWSNGNATVTVETPFSVRPRKNSIWIIEGQDINGRLYRVMAVQEREGLFTISALFHDPNKYARVEQGIALDPIAYVRPRNTVSQPSNITSVESRYFQDGVSHSRVSLSWSAPNDFMVVDFTITADSPRGFVAFPATHSPNLDINDAAPGEWTFYVSARGRGGKASVPVPYTVTIEGWQAVDGPIVDGLQVTGGGNTFNGTAPTLTWSNVFPTDAVEYAVENVVRVYDVANHLLRTETVRQNSYTYTLEKNVNDGGPRRAFRVDVTAKKVTGDESPPASINVSNPVPAVIVPVFNTKPDFLEVSYTPPTDSDFAGVLIWVSDESAFDPSLLTPTYDGPDTKISLALAPGTHYVRIAGYDRFGKIGLNISSASAVTITSVDEAIARVAPEIIALVGATRADIDNLGDAIANVLDQIIRDRDDANSVIQKTRQTLSVRDDNLSASVLTETSARIEGDLAEAQARTVLQATLDGVINGAIATLNATVADEQIARATADDAEAAARLALAATVATNTAAILTEQTARADADSAEATARLALATTVAANSAAILSEQTARANADSAEATARLALASTVSANSAAITTEQTTRANADTALSSSISTLSTTVGGHTSSISTVTSSVNGIKVQFGVVGVIDGVTGGFIFQGVKKLDGSVQYDLLIDGDVIVDGTITADKMSVNTLSAITANVGTLTAGIIRDAASKMIINLNDGTIKGYS